MRRRRRRIPCPVGGCFWSLTLYYVGFSRLKEIRKIIFSTQFIPKFFLFPFFYYLTPVIIILLKVVKILKPSSSFVKKQAKDASSGESLFEATPQIILQVCGDKS